MVLEELDFSNNYLTSKSVSSLIGIIKSFRSLKILNICSNKIDYFGLAQLLAEPQISCFFNIPKTCSVKLDYTGLSDQELGEILSIELRSHPEIDIIEINFQNIPCGFHDAGFRRFAHALLSMPNIKSLSLTGLLIPQEALYSLLPVIKNHPEIQRIELKNCSMPEEFVKVLLQCVVECPEFKEISLLDSTSEASWFWNRSHPQSIKQIYDQAFVMDAERDISVGDKRLSAATLTKPLHMSLWSRAPEYKRRKRSNGFADETSHGQQSGFTNVSKKQHNR